MGEAERIERMDEIEKVKLINSFSQQLGSERLLKVKVKK